jgi:hypothetical protein
VIVLVLARVLETFLHPINGLNPSGKRTTKTPKANKMNRVEEAVAEALQFLLI